MPSAMQYGMTARQFWYGDLRLMEVYHKSYMRNSTYQAWLNGMYQRLAVEIGAKNALSSSAENRIDEWVEYVDPIKTKTAKEISEEEFEKKFRETQMRESNWVKSLLNK